MKAKLTRQFPHAFSRIQIWAIRRKIVNPKVRLLCVSPGFVHFRMMVFGVVTYDHDAFAFLSATLLKELHEIPEALPIEPISFSRIDESDIAQAYRTKVSYTLSSGVVQDYRVPVFWRHPHAVPGAILLKMNLVQCP